MTPLRWAERFVRQQNPVRVVPRTATSSWNSSSETACLFHWITEVGGGLRVTDVWQAREQFDRFAQEKIGPISAQVGMPQPQIKFIDVANFMTAGS